MQRRLIEHGRRDAIDRRQRQRADPEPGRLPAAPATPASSATARPAAVIAGRNEATVSQGASRPTTGAMSCMDR